MKIFILLLNFCFVYISLSNSSIISFERIKGASLTNTIKGGFVHDDTLFLNRNKAGILANSNLNGINNWKTLKNNLPSFLKYSNFFVINNSYFHQNNDGVIFADYAGYLFVSSDYGATWEDKSISVDGYFDASYPLVNDGFLIAKMVTRPQHYVYIYDLFYSLDNGMSWKKFDNNTSSQFYSFTINKNNQIITLGSDNRLVKCDLDGYILQEGMQSDKFDKMFVNIENTLLINNIKDFQLYYFKNCDISKPDSIDVGEKVNYITPNDKEFYLTTSKNLITFNYSTKELKTIYNGDDIIVSEPFFLKSNLIIPCKNYFIVWNQDNQSYKKYDIEEHLLTDSLIFCTEILPDKEIILSKNDGVFFSQGNHTYWYKVDEPILEGEIINQIRYSSKNIFYSTMGNQLIVSDTNYKNFQTISNISINDSITSLNIYKNQYLIISTIGKSYFIDIDSINSNNLTEISTQFSNYFEVYNNTMFTSKENKLYKMLENPNMYELYYTFPESMIINTLIVNKYDDIFVGTNNGVYRKKINENNFLISSLILNFKDVKLIQIIDNNFLVAYGRYGINGSFGISYADISGVTWRSFRFEFIENGVYPFFSVLQLYSLENKQVIINTNNGLWLGSFKNILDDIYSWEKYKDEGVYFNDFNFSGSELFLQNNGKMILNEPSIHGSFKSAIDYNSGRPEYISNYKYYDKVNTNHEVTGIVQVSDVKSNLLIKSYRTTYVVQNNSILIFIDIYDSEKDTLIYSFNYETNPKVSGTSGQLLTFNISFNTFFGGRFLYVSLTENWGVTGKYPVYTYAYKRFFFDIVNKSNIENPFKNGLIRARSNHNDNRVFYLHKEDIIDSDSAKIEIIFLDLNNFVSNTIFSTIMEKSDEYIQFVNSEDENYFYFSYNSKIYYYDRLNSKLKLLFQNLNNVRFNIDFRNRHILINSYNKLSLYNINSLELEQYFSGLDNSGNVVIYQVPNKNAFVMISNDWWNRGFKLVKYESDILNGIDEGVKYNNLVKDDIVVYPNPTTEYITINHIITAGKTFKITNITGYEIPILDKMQITDNSISIDMTSFISGTYYLNISDKTSSKTYKILKI